MYICGNCFQPVPENAPVCPHCAHEVQLERARFPFALQPGTMLHSRYRIGRVLGKGGFGITYTALDPVIGQLVAIKEFYPDTMASRTTATQVTPYAGDFSQGFDYNRQAFLEEARTMAMFSANPNIVSVRDIFEENGTAYYVMEYVEGLNLKEYPRRRGRRLSWDEVLHYTIPIMQALEAIHAKGYVHRDVTPDNVFVTKDGRVKLLDFGSARYSVGDVTRSMDVVLKHGFAPREQYIRRSHQGPYTDIYSLGATMYYLATGKMVPDALERTEQDQLVPPSRLCTIPPHQEKALLKALAVDAKDRFQAIAEFRSALLAPAAPAAPVTPAAPAASAAPAVAAKSAGNSGKLPLLLGIGGAAAVLVAVLAAVLLLMPRKDQALPQTAAPLLQQSASQLQQTAPQQTEPPQTTPPETKPDYYAEASEHCNGLYRNNRYIEAVEYARQMAKEHPEEPKLSQLVQDAEQALESYALKQAKEAIHSGKLRQGVCDLNDVRAVYDSTALARATVEVKQAFGQHSIAASRSHTAVINQDGTLFVTGHENRTDANDLSPSDVRGWGNITSVSLGDWLIIALTKNGTVICAGDELATQKAVTKASSWSNVVMVTAGDMQFAALTADGTVLQAGYHGTAWELDNLYTDSPIISIAAGEKHLVALHEDGTVTAVGREAATSRVSQWRDIIAIACGTEHTVGLKADGTVVACGSSNSANATRVTGWANVDRIACGNYFTLAVNSAGEALCVGDDVSGITWSNVRDIAGGNEHAVALTTDGKIVYKGRNSYGQIKDYSGKVYIP